ncbi:MAG: transferase [Pelatocladus maniniholoensis HA4357-MV3]|uniref:Transferase n=1 Tax=Pelatocladus maniniholoensis HA4357-MV3 TaxID=1117104 RepID=A0A9E3LWW6_9NOST|nr:transferase [Pelatocladus maniniholoensis HA4357-MV3]BAZ67288.1 hexapeptide repeat-containing transferase [Fischerella sp. NIES-4106]
MSVPPLRLGNNFDSYISGEVIIHPTAVIAPGVILQAAPSSKIVIGSGVCIGMGSILKVHEGTLEVETGANLGAGFLMIGSGKIGANACIGSATTVFNCSVEPGQVVVPGSVLGDNSRHLSDSFAVTEKIQQPQLSTTNPASSPENMDVQEPEDLWNEEDTGTQKQNETGNFSASSTGDSTPASKPTPPHPQPSTSSATQNSQLDNQVTQDPTTESENHIGTHIYGQGSIQQLLITLFPHRQSLNKPSSDGKSE